MVANPLSQAQDFFISLPLEKRRNLEHTNNSMQTIDKKIRLEKILDNSQSKFVIVNPRSCLPRPVFPKCPQGDFLEHSRICPADVESART